MRRSLRAHAPAIAAGLGLAAAFAFAAWMLEPRFAVPTPAPIDDWAYASEVSPSIGDLLAPFVETPEGRFRPGWDLFQDLTWHTFGAPDMTGPNLWNLLRTLLFIAAVGFVPALVARWLRPSLRPVTLFAIAALPPALVLATAAVPVNFARLGTQEPMLIGFALCGGALMFWGIQRFFASDRPGLGIAAVLAGWPLYVIGVFSKEPGVAYGVLIACGCLALLQSWREEDGPGVWRRAIGDWRIVATLALFLLPLLWEAFRVAGTGAESADIYDQGSPESLSEWADRLEAAFRLQWDGITSSLGTALWRALAVGLPFLIGAVWLDRRRVPWLAIGCYVTGWLMLVIQGIPGALASRYYIPTIALFAIAATFALVAGRGWLRWTAIAAGVLLVLSSANGTRSNVVAWASDQTDTSNFVTHIAGLQASGCEIHMARISFELAQSLPVLVGMRGLAPGNAPCPEGDALLAVDLATVPAPSGRVGEACRSEWEPAYSVGSLVAGEQTIGGWTLWRCDDPGESRDDAAALRKNLLVPGVPDTERKECLDEMPVEACNTPAAGPGRQ